MRVHKKVAMVSTLSRFAEARRPRVCLRERTCRPPAIYKPDRTAAIE